VVIALGTVTLLLRPTFKNHLGSLLQRGWGIISNFDSRKAMGCFLWLQFGPQT